MFVASFAVWASTAHATDFCMTDPRVEAVDSSAPVTQSFLDQIKAIGIKTIIRYYDHEDETLPDKTLRRGERDAILMNGLKMGVVFQHRNNKFASFTALRGRQDAERSLMLAAENSQPRGSAIYFGVDGAWNRPYELAEYQGLFPGSERDDWRAAATASASTAAAWSAMRCWPTAWPSCAGWPRRPRGPISAPGTRPKDGNWSSFPRRSAAAAASISISPMAPKRNTANSGDDRTALADIADNCSVLQPGQRHNPQKSALLAGSGERITANNSQP